MRHQEQIRSADIALGDADDEAQVGIVVSSGNRAGFDVFFCRAREHCPFDGLGQGNFFRRRQEGTRPISFKYMRSGHRC